MKTISIFAKTVKILHGEVPNSIKLHIIGSLLVLIIQPVELFMVKALVDSLQKINQAESINNVIILSIILAIVLIMKSTIFGTSNALAMTRIGEVGVVESERLVVSKSSRLSLTSLESPGNKNKYYLASKISIDSIYFNSLEYLVTLIQSVILIGILTFFGDWRITLIILGLILVQAVVNSKIAKNMTLLVRKHSASNRVLDYISELLTDSKAAKELRLFNLKDYLVNKHSIVFNKNSKEEFKHNLKGETIKIIPELSVALIMVFILASILLFVGREGKSPGDFILFFQTAMLFFGVLPNLLSLHGTMKTIQGQWVDLEQYLNLDEDQHRSNHSGDKTVLGLSVNNATYKYPDADKYAVYNMSFKIKSGIKIAIVGENGSGKTTLIKLLLGLYSPDWGEIKWITNNGEKNSTEMNDLFSVVYQDYTKYNLTVAENVAIGRIENLENEKLIKASLEKAYIGEEFNGNINAQLGSTFGGIEPSIGQWQRIATARGYARQGDIIFFDEPTAALDPKAENEVFKAFLDMVEGHTSFIVTHRLGAARLSDLILVMKDGQLVEQGTHNDLVNSGGEYERLFKLQSDWYL